MEESPVRTRQARKGAVEKKSVHVLPDAPSTRQLCMRERWAAAAASFAAKFGATPDYPDYS